MELAGCVDYRATAAVLMLLLNSCGLEPSCGDAPSNWLAESDTIPDLLPVNKVVLQENGQYTWNSVPVSEGKLQNFLQETGNSNPKPFLVVKYEHGTSCRKVSRARNLIDAKYDCSDGSCGEGSLSRY